MSRSAARLLAVFVLSLSGLSSACDDDPQAAPPGQSDGGPTNGGRPTPPRPRPDSGTPNDDRDSGTDEDAATAGSGGSGGSMAPTPSMPSECQDFEPAMFIGGDPSVEVVASIAQPLDFEVTRAVATWEPDCSEPRIRVDLSDGSCPNGKGHQLTFWFAAEAIDSGAIFAGLNTVLSEPDNGGITIRYTRPSRLSPDGIWGTCPISTANLNFAVDPSTDQFSDLEVSSFSLELAPCDARANDLIMVVGSFNVELQRGLREACPPD